MCNLYWHRSINFGDMLSPYLLSKLKGEINYVEANDPEHKYILTGSILSVPMQNASVFGAGFINETDVLTGSANIIAVRGKLTQQKVGGMVGEPSMCLPYFYNPKPHKKRLVGYTPHIMDYKPGQHNIDLRMGEDETIVDAVERVIYQINECGHIVSSSLHGLIVAKAYGIPYTYVHSDSLVGDGFKFRDFFASEYDVKKIYDSLLSI